MYFIHFYHSYFLFVYIFDLSFYQSFDLVSQIPIVF